MDVRFQYPLRVEVGCNLLDAPLDRTIRVCFSTLYGSKWVATKLTPAERNAVIAVSVPSTGRSGLQHDQDADDWALHYRFSTLYVSKWVATLHNTLLTTWWALFQYPLRVEVGCNLCSSDRREVNMASFSTLYGSKWVATPSGYCGK